MQKSQSYLFKTGQNFAVGKTLVCSAHVWRTATATATIFPEKNNELGSHFSQIRFKEMVV